MASRRGRTRTGGPATILPSPTSARRRPSRWPPGSPTPRPNRRWVRATTCTCRRRCGRRRRPCRSPRRSGCRSRPGTGCGSCATPSTGRTDRSRRSSGSSRRSGPVRARGGGRASRAASCRPTSTPGSSVGCGRCSTDLSVVPNEAEPGLWDVGVDAPERIVVVAHGGTNSTIVASLLGVEPEPWEWERFSMGHASAAVLTTTPVAGANLWSLRCPGRRHPPPHHRPHPLSAGQPAGEQGDRCEACMAIARRRRSR